MANTAYSQGTKKTVISDTSQQNLIAADNRLKAEISQSFIAGKQYYYNIKYTKS